MPRIATNDIGTWINGEDARLSRYTLAQTHGSPVCTLNLHLARKDALIFSPWGARALALDLWRFAQTHHLSLTPSGPGTQSADHYEI